MPNAHCVLEKNKAPRCGHSPPPGIYGEALPLPLKMTRTKSIKIRVTAEEYGLLKAIAGSRGISALLRNRALKGKSQNDRIERRAVVAELARMRNTLSLIGRYCERCSLPDQIQIVIHLCAVERALSSYKSV